ncbi:methylmalonyl-CoA mutase family protein [Streptomyces sp. NPDC001500]
MSAPGAAAEVNAAFRRRVGAGARTVPVVFDLATRAGLDSDASGARGLVGRCGVPVDSIDDMRVLFGGLRLGRIFPTLAADASAAPLLLLYQLVAEEHGTPARRLAGAVRNDVFRGPLDRGTGGLPLRSRLRLAMDVVAYGLAELPRWQSLSVCGHRLAGPGADPALEIARTVAGGVEYLRAAAAAGLDAHAVVPRFSICLTAGATARESRAKLRAARGVWARTTRERLAPGLPAPRLYVRHSRLDPPSAPPRPRPPASAIEAAALALLARTDRPGGALTLLGLDGGAARPAPRSALPPHPAADALRARQSERLSKLRAWRIQSAVDEALRRLHGAAESDDNVLYPMKEALAARATVGEVCATLHTAWAPGLR